MLIKSNFKSKKEKDIGRTILSARRQALENPFLYHLGRASVFFVGKSIGPIRADLVSDSGNRFGYGAGDGFSGWTAPPSRSGTTGGHPG